MLMLNGRASFISAFIFQQLVIFVVVAADPFFVVSTDDTSEHDDMAKALALSNRFFWRNMMAKWGCQYGIKIQPNQIRAKSVDELKRICESWKIKALAADAYVKSWECMVKKQQQQLQHVRNGGASSSTSSAPATISTAIIHDQMREEDAEFFRFDCLCVKPRFQVQLGELQLSSAMELIKASYRILFGWSEADGPIVGMIFENERAWDVVDRWLNVHYFSLEYGNTRGELVKIEKMLLIAKGAIEEDAYFDIHKILSVPQFFDAPQRVESDEDILKNLLAQDNVVTYEEKLTNGTHRNYFVDLKNLMKQLKKMNKKLLKRVNRRETDLTFMTDLKTAHENYLEIWEIIQELGLNLVSICEASLEYKTKFYDNGCILKHFWMTKKKVEQFYGKIDARYNGEPKHWITEIELGPLLWQFKHLINDPMAEKHPIELENLFVLDPCEEAKLKLKHSGNVRDH